MPYPTLGERSQKLAQRKARHEAQETALEIKQRKARTRLLIRCGELAERTGLLNLEADALYGAMLSLEKDAADEKVRARWAEAGRKALASEAAKAEITWAPVIIKLDDAHPQGTREVSRELRATDLRYNPVFAQWEGRLDPEVAAALARKHGGSVRRFVGSDWVDLPMAAE